MIKTSFIISVLLLALLLANSDLVSAERSLKSKGEKSDLPKLADSETAYKYQYMAESFFAEVDNIVNEKPENVTAFYYARVAALSTDDVVWYIDTPLRKFQLNGTEAVLTLWKSFATRRFSYTGRSHYEVTKIGKKDVQVELRYHGIVLEGNLTSNYQDVFGNGSVTFNDHDLIYKVFISRFYTIDRGYGL